MRRWHTGIWFDRRGSGCIDDEFQHSTENCCNNSTNNAPCCCFISFAQQYSKYKSTDNPFGRLIDVPKHSHKVPFPCSSSGVIFNIRKTLPLPLLRRRRTRWRRAMIHGWWWIWYDSHPGWSNLMVLCEFITSSQGGYTKSWRSTRENPRWTSYDLYHSSINSHCQWYIQLFWEWTLDRHCFMSWSDVIWLQNPLDNEPIWLNDSVSWVNSRSLSLPLESPGFKTWYQSLSRVY